MRIQSPNWHWTLRISIINCKLHLIALSSSEICCNFWWPKTTQQYFMIQSQESRPIAHAIDKFAFEQTSGPSLRSVAGCKAKQDFEPLRHNLHWETSTLLRNGHMWPAVLAWALAKSYVGHDDDDGGDGDDAINAAVADWQASSGLIYARGRGMWQSVKNVYTHTHSHRETDSHSDTQSQSVSKASPDQTRADRVTHMQRQLIQFPLASQPASQATKWRTWRLFSQVCTPNW